MMDESRKLRLLKCGGVLSFEVTDKFLDHALFAREGARHSVGVNLSTANLLQ